MQSSFSIAPVILITSSTVLASFSITATITSSFPGNIIRRHRLQKAVKTAIAWIQI